MRRSRKSQCNCRCNWWARLARRLTDPGRKLLLSGLSCRSREVSDSENCCLLRANFSVSVSLIDRSGDFDLVKLNIIDKIIFFRHEIAKITCVSKTLKMFFTKSEDVPVILKFSYAGNIQYHKLNKSEVRILVSELSSASGLEPNFEDI